MEKGTIKLNENQLKNIIKESVKKVLKESWQDDEIYAEIEKEGGMSWTDKESGRHIYIEEYEKPNGMKVYLVCDEDGGIFAQSQYLHKAQRSLYNAAVKIQDFERIKRDGLRDMDGNLV